MVGGRGRINMHQAVVGSRRFPEVHPADCQGRDGLLNVVSAETDMLNSRPRVYLQKSRLEHYYWDRLGGLQPKHSPVDVTSLTQRLGQDQLEIVSMLMMR